MLCQITREMEGKNRLLTTLRRFKIKKRSLEGHGDGDLAAGGFQASPALPDNPKNVVMVMDGARGLNIETLQSALENNIIPTGCTVTLLGVMSWPNVPISSKTWLDVWTVELDDAREENEELMSNFKYLKLKAFLDLCKKHGVVPQKEVAIGHNRRLRIVEKITGLHASWVIFDRDQKKNIDFYAQRIPCKLVMLNENGEANTIKDRPCVATPDVSPFTSRN